MEHIKPPNRVLDEFPNCDVVGFLPPDEVGICEPAFILVVQEFAGPWDGMTILKAYFKISPEDKQYIMNAEEPVIELNLWGAALPPFSVNVV